MAKLHAINNHLMQKADKVYYGSESFMDASGKLIWAEGKGPTNDKRFYWGNKRERKAAISDARKAATSGHKRKAATSDVQYARTKGSVTFVVGTISVQVILRLYKSRPEVLMAFDLDSCAVGYDGETVWALPRARRALNGRFNMIDETRPNVKYEARLFKYSERGFAVGVPGMRPDRENVHIDTYVSHIDDLSGLGLLSCLRSPSFFD